MNSRTAAIVASILIIALASSAIIGVTYSWFSDEDEVGISFTPGKIDINTSITGMKVNGVSDTDNDNVIIDKTTKVELIKEGNGCAIQFNNAQPGDVLEFNLVIEDESNIKAKWAVIAGSYNQEIYDIKITCDGVSDCSKYTDFSEGKSVEVSVEISINTGVEVIPTEYCELTITAYATQSINTATSPGAE